MSVSGADGWSTAHALDTITAEGTPSTPLTGIGSPLITRQPSLAIPASLASSTLAGMAKTRSAPHNLLSVMVGGRYLRTSDALPQSR